MDSNYNRALPKSTMIGMEKEIAARQAAKNPANEIGINRHERRKLEVENKKMKP